MDNILIAEAIAQGKNKTVNEIEHINNNASKINKRKFSNINYKLFLEYMETLWSSKINYDVKTEIQKYYTWSKNAESTYN